MDFGLPAKVVLIRHAQSERNAAKRGETFFKDAAARDAVAGTPDHLTPLSDLGRLQAAEAGQRLKERFGRPALILHSGYHRTVQTTEGILAAYGESERARIEIRRDWRIREREPGWGFNMTEDEARSHFPWLKGMWSEAGPFFAQPPGGESLVQVVDRVAPVIGEFNLGEEGRTIFIVSHGNTIRCMRFLFESMTYEQVEKTYWPPNCGVVAYDMDPATGEMRLIVENERFCSDPPE